MQINSISVPAIEIAGPSMTPAADRDASFGDILHNATAEIDKMQANANQKVMDLLAGNSQDVHSAMIAVEQANLSFELMMQLRNKMVSAYQEISRLQF